MRVRVSPWSHKMGYRIAAIAGDCKSPLFRVRRFESVYPNNKNKNMKEYKFKVGDKVYKPKGYKFPGVVVSVFETTSGEIRIVAELEDNGMLHIFSESQLEKRD